MKIKTAGDLLTASARGLSRARRGLKKKKKKTTFVHRLVK